MNITTILPSIAANLAVMQNRDKDSNKFKGSPKLQDVDSFEVRRLKEEVAKLEIDNRILSSNFYRLLNFLSNTEDINIVKSFVDNDHTKVYAAPHPTIVTDDTEIPGYANLDVFYIPLRVQVFKSGLEEITFKYGFERNQLVIRKKEL